MSRKIPKSASRQTALRLLPSQTLLLLMQYFPKLLNYFFILITQRISDGIECYLSQPTILLNVYQR